VKGPFVVEGMIQGGLGGAIAVALLGAVAQVVAREATVVTELLGRTAVVVPTWLNLAIVSGGMWVGVVGSLVSLGRSKV
jgi:cell division protein FtsX